MTATDIHNTSAEEGVDEPRIAILNALGASLAGKRRDAVSARAANRPAPGMTASATSGIYSIANTVTGKLYIGSAVNLANRASYHRWQLRKSVHHSQKLQRAWDKYGEAAFVFKTLLICAPKDLLMYEQIALDALNPMQHGYNILPTAGSALGMKHSAETRARMSAKNLGKVMSPESRAKMRARMLGSVRSAEVRSRISAANKGRALPPEFIAQMGKREIPHSTRSKISSALMGHKVSDETRQRMRDAARARLARQAQQKAIAA